jgi:ElaB/YqjD/DUF883 family membrane-anchored ribosome-binding protein
MTNMPGSSNLGTKSESMESTHRVQEALQDLGRAGKDAANELVGAARTTATKTYQEGRRKVVVARDRLADYVQENPVRSVLIATAAGAVLGAYLARRRS